MPKDADSTQNVFGLWNLTLMELDSKKFFINSITLGGPPNLELKKLCSFGVFSNSNFSVRMPAWLEQRWAINRHDPDLFSQSNAGIIITSSTTNQTKALTVWMNIISQSAALTRLIWREDTGSMLQMIPVWKNRWQYCSFMKKCLLSKEESTFSHCILFMQDLPSFHAWHSS